MNNTPSIHNGYMQDSSGRLVPESAVKPIDKTRDALVQELVFKARRVSAQIADFKTRAFADISAFIELSAGEYQVKVGGNKGNVTLVSFDGRYKVLRQVQESLAFDERLHAAKKLIDECIEEWTEGGNANLRVLVNDAFQVNKEGKINTQRVLSLQRMEIREEKWQMAMKAIRESVWVSNSKSYIRLYERVGDTDRYVAIPLDVAGV